MQRPSDVDKFGIFFCRGRDHLRDNHRFMAQLAADSVRTINEMSQRILRLNEIEHLRYPSDFPTAFREAAYSDIREPWKGLAHDLADGRDSGGK